jgi:branched-chain amino acid transport system ATP-binding protein
MFEVRDLHSGYGEAVVVRGVSLYVGAGEIVALLGRNGMGKTTLIRSIMGLTPPQVRSGSISWRGESLLGLCGRTRLPTARSRSCRRAGDCSLH